MAEEVVGSIYAAVASVLTPHKGHAKSFGNPPSLGCQEIDVHRL